MGITDPMSFLDRLGFNQSKSELQSYRAVSLIGSTNDYHAMSKDWYSLMKEARPFAAHGMDPAASPIW